MKRIMNTGFTWAACFLAAVLLTSCVSSTTGPKFTQVQPPEPGKSKVYIYRPFNAMGSSDSPAVLHNGEKILELLPIRTYFTHSVNPGRHTFETSRALVRAIPVTIDIENPGQTRYIRVEYKFGVPYAFKMVEVNEKQAFSELPDCYRTGVSEDTSTSGESGRKESVEPVSSKEPETSSGETAESSEPIDKKAVLYVDTVPENARIRIMTIKPKFFQGIELEKGPHLIEVSAKGYKLREKWIRLDSGETRRMQIELRPEPAAKSSEKSVGGSTEKGETSGNLKQAESGNNETGKTAFPEDLDSEAARIARLIQNDEPADKHRGVKLAVRKYPKKTELLQVAEQVLREEYNTRLDDRLHVDTMAWICKYLGYSGKKDFKPLLLEIADECNSRKIRKYAVTNAEKL